MFWKTTPLFLVSITLPPFFPAKKQNKKHFSENFAPAFVIFYIFFFPLGYGSIKDTLQVSLVGDATVEPSSVSIFNHPDNREFIHVLQGSGYFEVANGNANVAETKYISTNQTVRIKPLTDGDVVLTIRDLCLQVRA